MVAGILGCGACTSWLQSCELPFSVDGVLSIAISRRSDLMSYCWQQATHTPQKATPHARMQLNTARLRGVLGVVPRHSAQAPLPRVSGLP